MKSRPSLPARPVRVARVARACVFALLLTLAACASAVAQQRRVGAFDGQADVGAVKRPGSARYDAARAEYVVAGVGLGDEVYVGLFVCSHNAGVTERAAFKASPASNPRPALCRIM
jgi:hypothetical protein